MTRQVVVAGFGNPLRSDDGLGWQVADTLAERWGDRVTFLTGHQPLPEWATILEAADIAFFVDATLQPIQRVRLRRLRPATNGAILDGHTFGLEQLLQLTLAIYGRAPAAYVLELPSNDLSFGERLSARAARVAERAVRLLDRHLAVLA